MHDEHVRATTSAHQSAINDARDVLVPHLFKFMEQLVLGSDELLSFARGYVAGMADAYMVMAEMSTDELMTAAFKITSAAFGQLLEESLVASTYNDMLRRWSHACRD